MRPLFITFEGLDGSGKSTHLGTVAGWLAERGIPHLVTHEPGGTRLGEVVRGVFLDPEMPKIDGVVEALLVFASRRQHLREVIDPALADGRVVLCDRFTDSTMAYQGSGRGVPGAELAALDRLATGGRIPDRTFLFDLPAELARERGHSHERQRKARVVDRLDAETLDFYQRLRASYLRLAAENSDRIKIIDSSGTRRETGHQMRLELEDLLGPGE